MRHEQNPVTSVGRIPAISANRYRTARSFLRYIELARKFWGVFIPRVADLTREAGETRSKIDRFRWGIDSVALMCHLRRW